MLIFQEILRCFRSPITVRIRVLCRSANGASEIRAGGDTSEKALKVQSSKFSKSHHNSSLPQLALCSPGAQLLQADLGSTLQLRRLRSGRADRIRWGKPPLQSVWVRILWRPGASPGPSLGTRQAYQGATWEAAGRLSLRYPQVQTSVMEPKVFSEMSFFIPSPPISLSPPQLKELGVQCSEP